MTVNPVWVTVDQVRSKAYILDIVGPSGSPTKAYIWIFDLTNTNGGTTPIATTAGPGSNGHFPGDTVNINVSNTAPFSSGQTIFVQPTSTTSGGQYAVTGIGTPGTPGTITTTLNRYLGVHPLGSTIGSGQSIYLVNSTHTLSGITRHIDLLALIPGGSFTFKVEADPFSGRLFLANNGALIMYAVDPVAVTVTTIALAQSVNSFTHLVTAPFLYVWEGATNLQVINSITLGPVQTVDTLATFGARALAVSLRAATDQSAGNAWLVIGNLDSSFNPQFTYVQIDPVTGMLTGNNSPAVFANPSTTAMSSVWGVNPGYTQQTDGFPNTYIQQWSGEPPPTQNGSPEVLFGTSGFGSDVIKFDYQFGGNAYFLDNSGAIQSFNGSTISPVGFSFPFHGSKVWPDDQDPIFQNGDQSILSYGVDGGGVGHFYRYSLTYHDFIDIPFTGTPPAAMIGHFIAADGNNPYVYVSGTVSGVHHIYAFDTTGSLVKNLNASAINIAAVQKMMWVGSDGGGNTDKLVFWMGGNSFATVDTGTGATATFAISSTVAASLEGRYEGNVFTGPDDGGYSWSATTVNVIAAGNQLVAFSNASFSPVVQVDTWNTTTLTTSGGFVEAVDSHGQFAVLSLLPPEGMLISGWPSGHTYLIQSFIDSNHILMWDTVIQSADTTVGHPGHPSSWSITVPGGSAAFNNVGTSLVGSARGAWYWNQHSFVGATWNFLTDDIGLLRSTGVQSRPSAVGGQIRIDSAQVPPQASPSELGFHNSGASFPYPDIGGTWIPYAPAFGNSSLPMIAFAAGASTTISGSAASIGSLASHVIPITGLTGITPAVVGGIITFTGAGFSNFDGAWPIVSTTGSNQVGIGANGVSGPDPNNGTIGWSITYGQDEYMYVLAAKTGIGLVAETWSNWPAGYIESNHWSGISVGLPSPTLPPLGYGYTDGTAALWVVATNIGTHGTPFVLMDSGPTPRITGSVDPNLVFDYVLDGVSLPDGSLAGQTALPHSVSQLAIDVYTSRTMGAPSIWMLGVSTGTALTYYQGPANGPAAASAVPDFDFHFGTNPDSVVEGNTKSVSLITTSAVLPDMLLSYSIISGTPPGATIMLTGGTFPSLAGATFTFSIATTIGLDFPGTYPIVFQIVGASSGAVQHTLTFSVTADFDYTFSVDPVVVLEGNSGGTNLITSFITAPDTIDSFSVVSGLPPGASFNITTPLPALAGTTLAGLFSAGFGFAGEFPIVIQLVGHYTGAVDHTVLLDILVPAELVYEPFIFFEGLNQHPPPPTLKQAELAWGLHPIGPLSYLLRASCTSAPGGYIYWVNTSGDDSGKPGCVGTLGPTHILVIWRTP